MQTAVASSDLHHASFIPANLITAPISEHSDSEDSMDNKNDTCFDIAIALNFRFLTFESPNPSRYCSR
jgi:hypothetical protein